MRASSTIPLVERETSRLPYEEHLHMPGSQTTPGRQALAMTRRSYCLPRWQARRHPEPVNFHGSMAGLCTPLPTLRLHPRGCRRTARGQCGSLLLHRSGLSPPTPRRFRRRTVNL